MSGWRYYFKEDIIELASTLNVEIIEINEYEVKANVDNQFNVNSMIRYESPYFMNCNCSEKYQCVHEAALYLYLENHKELLKSEDKNIKDIDKNFYLKKLSNIFKGL